MNPTLDNDLQKAIDDITNNTNSDPVFGDAVAAPEPVAPTPMPTPRPAPSTQKSAPRPAPRPATPAMPSMPPVAPAPAPKPIAPTPLPPEPTMNFEEVVTASETVSEPAHEAPTDMKSVKEAALRDLAPILNKVDMDSSKKFNLYKNIREELHDNSVIAPAYETAKDIADDKERADALLYLIDSIDNM